jgi:hypothetical protein
LEVQELVSPKRILLLAPIEENRPYSVDGWTYCGTGTNIGPNPNSSQGPLLVSPLKNIAFRWSDSKMGTRRRKQEACYLK